MTLPDISVIYGQFAALTDLSADLGGWLLLYAGLDHAGVAVAMAANVAGAASLGIEPDADQAKAALRAGVCDFVVNNLGEALRILKNEIRQRRTVSVVVEGAVNAVAAEIVERGVQPEVLAFPVPELQTRGARLLGLGVAHSSRLCLSGEGGRFVSIGWSVASEPMRWLPVLDGLAISSLPVNDARVRWVEASPRYLGRAYARQRFLRMTDREADTFVTSVREAVHAGSVPVGVSMTRDGEPASIAP